MDIRVVKGDNNQVTVFDHVRGATRRHAGLDAVVRSPSHGQRAIEMERHRGRSHARHHHADLAGRHRHRSGRDRRHPFRRDRRLSRHARQRAGAGAGADRPVRRRHVERAVGHDDRRHGGHRRRADRLRRRYRQPAGRQFHQPHLYRQQRPHPAPDDLRAGRRYLGAAVVEHRHHQSQRHRGRARFLRRHRLGDHPDQCGAGRHQRHRLESEPAPPCAFSTTAPPTCRMSTRLSTTTTATATTGSVALPFFLDGNSPYTGAISLDGGRRASASPAA